MPFAEFTPGTAGLALPQHQLAATEQSFSLMQRAQSMRVQQQQLEMEKQHLASTLVVNAQQVEASRANVARLQVETEGARIDNTVKAATSKFTLGVIDQASRAFGSQEPSESGAPATGTSNFQQDVAALYNLPTETPKQLAEFKAKLAYVNSRYSALAEVHPAAKLMFDQALAPINAKIAGASGMMVAQSAQQARLLRTPLAQISTPEQLTSFLSRSADNHDFAMLDPEYQKLYEATAKDVRDKAQQLENSKVLQAGTLANEQKILTQKSTVDAEGFSGVAPTPEAAQKVRDAVAVYLPTKDALDKLDGIFKEVEGNPAKRLDRETTARAQIFQQQLISAIGRMQTGGVLSDAEAAVMKNLVPDPTKILSMDSANQAKLASLRHEMDIRMDALAVSNGVKRTKGAKEAPKSVSSGADLQSQLRATR